MTVLETKRLRVPQWEPDDALSCNDGKLVRGSNLVDGTGDDQGRWRWRGERSNPAAAEGVCFGVLRVVDVARPNAGRAIVRVDVAKGEHQIFR